MVTSMGPEHDRAIELRAFDETKSGVKGLVDAGIAQVPRIFVQPPDSVACGEDRADIPAMDLGHANAGPTSHDETARNIGLLEEVIEGSRGFFEQETEDKKGFYTGDLTKRVIHNSNMALYNSVAADWRDSICCSVGPEPPRPEELPEACGEMLMEYSKHVMRPGSCMYELLSKAIGLPQNHLKGMECGKGHSIICHYNPPCQPRLTLGVTKHSENDFLTILLQGQIGGLQVLHENRWIAVPPIPGALVINMGDLLQLITNDKFKSVEHRVMANKRGPRVSVACFFDHIPQPSSRLYGPIKELTSTNNPPIYKETTLPNYTAHYISKGVHGTSALPDFKL
ncbi:1-aminocyclopropane-1-carboxylate oxidase homolog 1-like [Rhodamnia argentea]|uniref:1-aminocyclopropane-1-carboxylate oxidase homolog 1-like n=1 Tax=Rhodamnia argentea TaxID=178133 RepID=A0ABM3HA89_9MYRT|nr:1-aminocyclopropane-1-carboxylate oxidase homolog 1-like [Rhodamnia argentea]